MDPGWRSTKGIVMLLRWLTALLFVGGLAVGLGAGMTATPSLIPDLALLCVERVTGIEPAGNQALTCGFAVGAGGTARVRSGCAGFSGLPGDAVHPPGAPMIMFKEIAGETVPEDSGPAVLTRKLGSEGRAAVSEP
jgi:hypothetical protein